MDSSRQVQEVHKADAFNNLGQVKWELALCLIVVFIFVYFALWKGIKSSGKVNKRETQPNLHFLDKVVWVTAITPYAVLFILLIRGLTLKGASLGINFYLTPKWELLKHLKVTYSILLAPMNDSIFSNDRFGMLQLLRSSSH